VAVFKPQEQVLYSTGRGAVMTRSFLALGFCTIFLPLSPQTSLADQCSKPFIVLEVNFPGSTRLTAQEQAEAKAKLIGACLDETQLGKMADAVRSVLKEAGYLRAAVPSPSMTVVDGNRNPEPVSLTFQTIDEGRRYTTSRIEWWYLNSFNLAQVRSVSTLRVGDVFERQKLLATIENVANVYRADGYAEASIVPELVFIEPSAVAVKFTVTEGVRR
jgi:outer membrane protein assembly factor BamA